MCGRPISLEEFERTLAKVGKVRCDRSIETSSATGRVSIRKFKSSGPDFFGLDHVRPALGPRPCAVLVGRVPETLPLPALGRVRAAIAYGLLID